MSFKVSILEMRNTSYICTSHIYNQLPANLIVRLSQYLLHFSEAKQSCVSKFFQKFSGEMDCDKKCYSLSDNTKFIEVQ